MYKKSVSIILSLILLVLISGFSSNSFATGIGNEFQTISSVRVDSVENRTFFSKAKMLSEEEALQYTQLQDQAFQNSILDHDGGGSAGEFGYYIGAAVVLAVAVLYVAMYN